MSEQYTNEPMLDMFIFETTQLIEQLEQKVLNCEKAGRYSQPDINEIFRIMHTIKGSSAMMMFGNISTLAHSIEDVFYYLREEKPKSVDCSSLSDLVFEAIDFIKAEVEKIKSGNDCDGDADSLMGEIAGFLASIKSGDGPGIAGENTPEGEKETRYQQYYISQDKARASMPENSFKAVVYFQEGCEMENIRAYSIIHNLKELADQVVYFPEDIMDSDESVDIIRREGFTVYLKSSGSFEQIHDFFFQTVFLKDLELVQLENDDEMEQVAALREEVPGGALKTEPVTSGNDSNALPGSHQQSIISVSVSKLDKLMDLTGEMVIAEAMVIQNPDLAGLELDNFQKAAQQLNKITDEIQDMVMSIRMVPLSASLQRMHRILRDMCKKLGKEVRLEIIGEETEVDKNIIEHISDPLMHLVRNALDHGIEPREEREAKGKPRTGVITLEARNAGSDVLIIVSDDGKGLEKEALLDKAEERGLLTKPREEMSDKEIFSLIFMPGFSTKEIISEFSGRGVGMDVVTKNIEKVGGSVSADSAVGRGTSITLKIPLTLAIIDGMNVKVGHSCYTIPIISIKESFRPNEKDIVTDPDGNEMIMVRGQCYPILRLHGLYGVKTEVMRFTEGIFIMVGQDGRYLCLFADELLGQQQVVVKSLPGYLKNFRKIQGLAGCTLLGDGSISLILDVAGLLLL